MFRRLLLSALLLVSFGDVFAPPKPKGGGGAASKKVMVLDEADEVLLDSAEKFFVSVFSSIAKRNIVSDTLPLSVHRYYANLVCALDSVSAFAPADRRLQAFKARCQSALMNHLSYTARECVGMATLEKELIGFFRAKMFVLRDQPEKLGVFRNALKLFADAGVLYTKTLCVEATVSAAQGLDGLETCDASSAVGSVLEGGGGSAHVYAEGVCVDGEYCDDCGAYNATKKEISSANAYLHSVCPGEVCEGLSSRLTAALREGLSKCIVVDCSRKVKPHDVSAKRDAAVVWLVALQDALDDACRSGDAEALRSKLDCRKEAIFRGEPIAADSLRTVILTSFTNVLMRDHCAGHALVRQFYNEIGIKFYDVSQLPALDMLEKFVVCTSVDPGAASLVDFSAVSPIPDGMCDRRVASEFTEESASIRAREVRPMPKCIKALKKAVIAHGFFSSDATFDKDVANVIAKVMATFMVEKARGLDDPTDCICWLQDLHSALCGVEGQGVLLAQLQCIKSDFERFKHKNSVEIIKDVLADVCAVVLGRSLERMFLLMHQLYADVVMKFYENDAQIISKEIIPAIEILSAFRRACGQSVRKNKQPNVSSLLSVSSASASPTGSLGRDSVLSHSPLQFEGDASPKEPRVRLSLFQVTALTHLLHKMQQRARVAHQQGVLGRFGRRAYTKSIKLGDDRRTLEEMCGGASRSEIFIKAARVREDRLASFDAFMFKSRMQFHRLGGGWFTEFVDITGERLVANGGRLSLQDVSVLRALVEEYFKDQTLAAFKDLVSRFSYFVQLLDNLFLPTELQESTSGSLKVLFATVLHELIFKSSFNVKEACDAFRSAWSVDSVAEKKERAYLEESFKGFSRQFTSLVDVRQRVCELSVRANRS